MAEFLQIFPNFGGQGLQGIEIDYFQWLFRTMALSLIMVQLVNEWEVAASKALCLIEWRFFGRSKPELKVAQVDDLKFKGLVEQSEYR